MTTLTLTPQDFEQQERELQAELAEMALMLLEIEQTEAVSDDLAQAGLL